jgi:hypothetical protein
MTGVSHGRCLVDNSPTCSQLALECNNEVLFVYDEGSLLEINLKHIDHSSQNTNYIFHDI